MLCELFLLHFRARVSDPISVVLNNGQTLYSIPPPGSGIILGKCIAIIESIVFHVYFLFAIIASLLQSYSILLYFIKIKMFY